MGPSRVNSLAIEVARTGPDWSASRGSACSNPAGGGCRPGRSRGGWGAPYAPASGAPCAAVRRTIPARSARRAARDGASWDWTVPRLARTRLTFATLRPTTAAMRRIAVLRVRSGRGAAISPSLLTPLLEALPPLARCLAAEPRSLRRGNQPHPGNACNKQIAILKSQSPIPMAVHPGASFRESRRVVTPASHTFPGEQPGEHRI